ncbi:kinesin-like protein KIN-12F isoform X2 [Typha latifolia]|uniref:kinesin-like protein KIN-12F isoform X1 n=2 Tax=Typha latifolia TaxID=4733 RepID=UPI003C2CA7BC
MLRDLKLFRRNPGKVPSSEGNNENLPLDSAEPLAFQPDSDPSRAPLNAIQEPVQNPKPGLDQGANLKRKAEATTPSKIQSKVLDGHLPFRTPEKQTSSRNRFGWVPKSEPGVNCMEESSHHSTSQLPPINRGISLGTGVVYSMNTPRTYRTAGKASSVHSDSSSTQSTPTKSVSKPAYAGHSGSRPPMSVGNRAISFYMASKGVPIASTPPRVVNSAEVPHFELKEDPSFWMDHNVQVVIRVRPLNSTERSLQGYNRCLKQENAQSITWIGQPETRFTFDYVACETVNQEMLFRVAGLPMVENCMSGYNSCMFAYGQTGSGKTYTMLGEISELEVRPSLDRGMTPRIFEFLFARIRAEEESRRDEKLKYSCKCSFLEIYNEQISDLLDPSSSNLLLREDIRNGVYVENLTEFEVESVNDILKLLIQGAANRKVAATNMNRESSRSHSVFTCVIESRWEKDSSTNFRFARLNLVDLAGSERQKMSGAEGERLKEAANINKSLSTLGHVIMLLSELANGKQRHVPYRDSRLTFLLQDSLGGNSKTMIIANVSPSICAASETLSTLKFAQRARLIQNNAVVNEDASGDAISLQHQIRLLKEELAFLRRQNVSRSLSFRTAIFEEPEAEYSDAFMATVPGVGQVNTDDLSLHSIRVSNKQLKSLEATLVGSLRREKMADTTIKQLEAEIEQLNRLVRQREEDTRCSKMMLKFREDKIHRMETLLDGEMPKDVYLLEENKALTEEIQLLHARVDRNPEVTRFALENIRLLDQLRRFQDFYEEGEKELLSNEVAQLRNQLIQILDGDFECNQQPNSDIELQDCRHPQFASSACADGSLSLELKMTNKELENCRKDLRSCLEINEKLTREMTDLHAELSKIESATHDKHLNAKPQNTDLGSEPCQEDGHAFVKMDAYSHEDRGHTEVLNLQLELDILKTILAEEKAIRTQVEKRALYVDYELKIANERALQLGKEQEVTESELKDARSVIEALESQEILLINELETLRENNHQNVELLKKHDLEISSLKNQLGVRCQGENKLCFAQESLRGQPLKISDSEDSPLQHKMKRMQASLDKARCLNLRYQSDEASQTYLEREMDEVRRQVEVETAEVIVCLQEELLALQQQVDSSSRNELLAKQSLVALETETRDLHERLSLIAEENKRLSEMVVEKDRGLRLLTEDWERSAHEIADALADGNVALEEASEQVASISGSCRQSNWIGEQVGRIIRGISEKDALIEELQKCLEDAQGIRDDLEWKLRSLRGATLAITEAQQQEASEKEKVILLLTSELSEKASVLVELEDSIKQNEECIRTSEVRATVAFMAVNRLTEMNDAHLEELDHMKLMLDESIQLYIQEEVLLHYYVALQTDAEKQNQHLRSQLMQSQEFITALLKDAQENEQTLALDKLKKEEEDSALSRTAADLLNAKRTINEIAMEMNTLMPSMNAFVEQANFPAEVYNSGNDFVQSTESNSEDKVEDVTFKKQRNIEILSGGNTNHLPSKSPNKSLSEDTFDRGLTILLLRKEVESALSCLQGIQAQMSVILNEKEKIKRREIQSKTSFEYLMDELLRMKSEITDKENHFQTRMSLLETKLQTIESNATASNACWHKTKEALELELNDAKAVSTQKTFEASSLLAKLEETQETIAEADILVNALMQANESAKLDIERYQQNESILYHEKNSLINVVQSLRSSLDMKEQEYELMKKKFCSDILEAKSLVLDLEEIVRHLQSYISEKLGSIACDTDWLKSQLQNFAEVARTWLEETWSAIIGKDCAVSVLHLCQMGILLERVTGLNVENGFLQQGLSESNSIISNLREHNTRAKRELEICSVLKGKLLADINNSFSRISKKEDETAEFKSRLSSFEKKILHLQLQEESMLSRSNSMYNELADLVKELDANKRNALAAASRENEVISRQLDEVLIINEMFRDSLQEDLDLLTYNVSSEFISTGLTEASDMQCFNESELFRNAANSRTELIMINMFAKDIELLVLVSEMEQNVGDINQMASQICELQKERDTFHQVLEKMMTEATLSNIDGDLKRDELYSLHEENKRVKNDFKKMKEDNVRIMEDLQTTKLGFTSSINQNNAMEQENSKLRDTILSCESQIIALQTDLDRKNSQVEELLCSHAVISKERDLNAEIMETEIEKANALKSENGLLKHELSAVSDEKDEIVSMLALMLRAGFDLAQSLDMDVNKMFHVMNGHIDLILDRVCKDIIEHKEVASKFANELELIELSVEKLKSENYSLQCDLMWKDEVSKGLLFDLSLLQESASIAKDQKDEIERMVVALESLEAELASRSGELDDAVSNRQIIETEVLEKSEKITDLELELSEKLSKLNLLSTENYELKSQMEDIKGMKNAIEEELAEKNIIVERLEEELLELTTLLSQRNCGVENLQNHISKLSEERDRLGSEMLALKEKMEMSQAIAEENEAIAVEAQQMAEERKAYAEEKEEEVKLLEKSIEELECTVYALENKVDIVKAEAERQKLQREELEAELQEVRHQMLTVPSSGRTWSTLEDRDIDLSRHLNVNSELQKAEKNIQNLQKEVAEKDVEIAQCKAHISELNMHAEAQTREYQQKFKDLEAMAQKVKIEAVSSVATNMGPTKSEKNVVKSRGSGSPFKCIGLGLAQQMNSEKDEELTAAKRQIEELEALAANRQKEIFMLNTRLAAAESMTHDVIRDLLGVKLDMTSYASLLGNHQVTKIKDTSPFDNQEHEEKMQEVDKLKKQLHEFIKERQSWLDEINQRHTELVAARITIEKLRHREQFLTTENEMFKAENANYKKMIMELEDEVRKLSNQQNLQLRIHHHAKTKEENTLLKLQNEELSARLQRSEAVLSRVKEELAHYRSTSGKNPYINIDDEELLSRKLQDSEEDRLKLAQELLGLCTSVLKAAGITKPKYNTSLSAAEDALNLLKNHITSLENEVQDLKLKCKLLREKVRLSELDSESATLCSRTIENYNSPSSCDSPHLSSL